MIRLEGAKDAQKLLMNIRTWVKGELPRELVDKTSISVLKKSKSNVLERTNKRTGELLQAHDRALFNRALSKEGYSATIIIEAINKRGHSYAPAVEFGAQNPLTGGFNRPRWFFRDAVEEVISQELEGIKTRAVSRMPKK